MPWLFDLSSRGEQEFTQLISNWTTTFSKSLAYFTQLTNDMLQESGIELSSLIDQSSTSIFPIVDIKRLRDDARTLRELPTVDATIPLTPSSIITI
ncbi:hypothetical protein V8C34DRAFT_137015 [Trichoderma compactum]